MPLRLPPDWVLPSLIKWAALVLVGELLWLSLLYPLMPTSPFAWTVTLLLPVPIGAYAYCALRGIFWLSPQPPAALRRQLLAAVLAISVGVLTFLLIAFAERQLVGQFQYGVFRSH
jgi:hypothetical protein